jgi:hypothetical protein
MEFGLHHLEPHIDEFTDNNNDAMLQLSEFIFN